jgi:hypothetical protein
MTQSAERRTLADSIQVQLPAQSVVVVVVASLSKMPTVYGGSYRC